MTAQRIGRIIASFAAVAIAVATLLPGQAHDPIPGTCLICGELGTADAILNALLFFPLGLGLALAGQPWKRAFLWCLATTVLIELLQMSAIPMRYSSVGDVVCNTIGAGVGLTTGQHWKRLVWPSHTTRWLLIAAANLAWIMVASVSAYSLQPSPTAIPLYGQLARKLANDPAYPGTVQAVRVGAIPIPDHILASSDSALDAVLKGQPLTVSVLPRATTTWLAPIVRVVDMNSQQLLVVSGLGDQATYSVNTNVSKLRLRPYISGIKGVLVPDVATTFEAVFVGGIARFTTVGPSGQSTSIVYGLASGWRLLVPTTFVSKGSALERGFDFLWACIWLFPLGYWIMASNPKSQLVPLAIMAFVVLAAGLLIKYQFALRADPLAESWPPFLAMMSGAVVGRIWWRPTKPHGVGRTFRKV